jgi:hypothetical protein
VQGIAPGRGAEEGRIARLGKQLGDDEFARPEAASKELEAIGGPAQAALRQAASSAEKSGAERGASSWR